MPPKGEGMMAQRTFPKCGFHPDRTAVMTDLASGEDVCDDCVVTMTCEVCSHLLPVGGYIDDDGFVHCPWCRHARLWIDNETGIGTTDRIRFVQGPGFDILPEHIGNAYEGTVVQMIPKSDTDDTHYTLFIIRVEDEETGPSLIGASRVRGVVTLLSK